MLIVALVVLVAYQAVEIRRDPLDPLPMPVSRRTGQPQQPNGAVITEAADTAWADEPQKPGGI